MEYYIYMQNEELFGRACSPKPYREMHRQMEIENFEDLEMEWQQKFDKLPEIKCHPDPRIKQYFTEQMVYGQFYKGVECDVVEVCGGDVSKNLINPHIMKRTQYPKRLQ